MNNHTGTIIDATNGGDEKKDEILTMTSSADMMMVMKHAMEIANEMTSRGTTYLHTKKMTTTTTSTNNDNNDNDDGSRSNPTGAVVVPISLATTFQQHEPGVPRAINDPNSFGMGYEYSRTGNPTRGAFERAVAQAECAKYCVAYSSGSAATSAVIHLLQSGDHVLCIDDVYGGTNRQFRRIVQPTNGISIDFVDFVVGSSTSKKEDDIFHKNRNTKLVWLETPTNPTLKITDIAELSKRMKESNMDTNSNDNNTILLAVDNTFCSPYFQNPLNLGADIVVHSVTKYIGGHSDVVMGVVCCNDEQIYQKLRFIQNGIGAVPSPFDCYLAHRGLKTLHIRMEASARNAYAIALFLENHKAVTKVLYPGLPSHPQHEIAKRQQHGFGAMITFYCVGGREESGIILRNLRIFALAESLGAVESLAECPSLMTHASVPDDQRAELGIDDSLIRLSVGIESCQDLIGDLDNALNCAWEKHTKK